MKWDTKRMAQYRIFNGERFYKTTTVKSKREANKQKRLWKNMHRNVRVVRVKSGYDIYISEVKK